MQWLRRRRCPKSSDSFWSLCTHFQPTVVGSIVIPLYRPTRRRHLHVCQRKIKMLIAMAPTEALPKVAGLFLVPLHQIGIKISCTTSFFSWPFCRWLVLAAHSETLLSCLANVLPIATCCCFFDLCQHYLDPPLSGNQAIIRLWIHDSSQNSCLLLKGRLTRTRPGPHASLFFLTRLI